MVESGQISAVHGVVRWRLIDLAQTLGSATPQCPGRGRD
jgi:hypothetical protein